MTKTEGKPLLLAMAMQLARFGGQRRGAGQAFMHTGGRTTQPVGHYEFCQREPEECRQKTPQQARRSN